MAITLRKQADSEVSAPSSPSRVSYYIDPDGVPKFKDSTGAITPAISLDGSPLLLNEQGSAPAAENAKGKLYAKDISGVTELFYRDDLGNGGKETQITVDGAVAGASAGALYFQDALISDDIVVNVPSGGGSIFYPTGLTLPALAANQSMILHLESRLVASDGADAGWSKFVFGWGTAPTFPIADLTDFFTALYDAGGVTNVQSVFQSASVDAGGAVSVEIGDGKASTLFGRLRVAITIDQLDFNPVPPP